MRILFILPICLLLVRQSVAQRGVDTTVAPAADTVLTLAESLRIAADNYSSIKAKQALAAASALDLKAAKQDGLPDVIAGVQAAYGTIDGSNGLSNGVPGLTTLTGGPTTPTQSWNAAFGTLYLTNIDWNLYSFGLQRAHVATARGQLEEDREALAQEVYQQQVKVAGAYLSLLAATHIRMAMEDNLRRTIQLREVIQARTVNGLNPGVDSSIANAEVSRARLSLIDAKNYEQEQANQLSTRMGIKPRAISVDTSASQMLPNNLLDNPAPDLANHPSMRFLASRITTSDLLATYIHKTGLPRVSLFAVGQDRGLLQGLDPYRANYLAGIGITWDFTDLSRSRSRAAAQRQRSVAFANDYLLEQNNLTNQLVLADQQISNALAKYQESPIQLKSAADAYMQKKALYENGLTNIVDVSQTLYLLNRAEIDRDVASNAVWQALLFKVATIGDLNPFLQQFK